MGYFKDLREHIAALDKAGLLIKIDEQINKDTELMPMVRWQFRGLPEEERRDASQQLQAESRETYNTLRDLRDQDRALQFSGLLRSLGISDDKLIQSGVDNLNTILDNTRYTAPGGGPGNWGGRDGQQQQQPPPQR